MKKAMLFLILFVLVLLPACGSREEDPQAVSPAPTESAVPLESAVPAESAVPEETSVPTAETWVPGNAPAALTYSWGGESREAILDGSWSWNYLDPEGNQVNLESREGRDLQFTDWLDGTRPILRAEGEVTLSFPAGCRMPDEMRLLVFSPMGAAPAALEGNAFTPYAGVNTYVLEARWLRGRPLGLANARYILLVEGCCPCELPETEDGVTVSLLEADARGCSFTLANDTDQYLYIGTSAEGMMGKMNYALFRRTDSGSWEWLQPLRYIQDDSYLGDPGCAMDLGLNWSFCQGTLEPGEYGVLLSGYSYPSRYAADVPKTDYLKPLYFTVAGEYQPRIPGPPVLQDRPEGVTAEPEERSPHSWVQKLSCSGEGQYVVDRDFSLFRLEGDELIFIAPEYELPSFSSIPVILDAARSSDIAVPLSLPVELAAAYGALEAGDYVLRRRLYPDGPDLPRWQNAFSDRSWRTIPEEDILHLDTVFTVASPLSDVPLPVEPYSARDIRTDPETGLPFAITEFDCDAQGFLLRMFNPSDQTLTLSVDVELYFYWQEEWFSEGQWECFHLEKRSRQGLWHMGHALEPGESEWSCSYAPGYAVPLAPGVYRLEMQILCYGGNGGSDRLTTYILVPEAEP